MKALYAIVAAASVAAATLASPSASAHAGLKGSSPEAGAMLAAPPREITLTFNEKIEQAFSSITVADGRGKDVTADKAKVDGANPAVLRLEEVDVAESRDFLPGHGGLLLRLDSLMFTAPVFFHFVFHFFY